MAGVNRARSVRGRYSSAGYTAGQGELYIARVPAGSRQDELRDMNRKGYRSERTWNEDPVSPLEQQGEQYSQASHRAPAGREPKPTFVDRLFASIRRELRDFVLCCVLLCVLTTLGVMHGRNMIEGVQLQEGIAKYQEDTAQLQRDNEKLEQDLEKLREGSTIRNKAKNDLKMERPERAQTTTIYIQTTDNSRRQMLQQDEEPKMELLDVLLGLLNVLNIGE